MTTDGIGAVAQDLGNLLPPDAACDAELAVFSAHTAMFLRISPNWKSAPNDVQIAWLKSPLQNRLNVWVQQGDPDGLTKARSEFFAARALLDKNRMGLITSGNIQETAVNLGTTTTPVGPGAGCHNLPMIQALGQPIYEPGEINVYFVPRVLRYIAPINAYHEKAGENCGNPIAPPGTPNVIFVSLSYYLPTILAHEIGHAFSLQHVNDGLLLEPDFTDRNIMYDGDTPTATEARDLLHLGQAYRANVNANSWLNIDPDGALGPLVPRRSGPTKSCQDSFVTPGPCPRQNQKWP